MASYRTTHHLFDNQFMAGAGRFLDDAPMPVLERSPLPARLMSRCTTTTSPPCLVEISAASFQRRRRADSSRWPTSSSLPANSRSKSAASLTRSIEKRPPPATSG